MASAEYGLGGLGKVDSKAVVKVTAKLIDINTARRISRSATGTGGPKRGGFHARAAAASGWSGGGGGGLDMGSSDFSNTILGEAVNASVADLGQHLDDKAASLPTTVTVDHVERIDRRHRRLHPDSERGQQVRR